MDALSSRAWTTLAIPPKVKVGPMIRMPVAALSLVVLSSTAANVALIAINHKLAHQIELLHEEQVVRKGVVLPPLKGVDLSGKAAYVDYKTGEQPTVLFVFSSTCSVCAKTWPQWDSVLATQKGMGWRPVFVNLGDPVTADYVASHSLDHYTTLDDITKDTVLSYRLFFTPETILLDGEGRVENVWIGQLSPDVTNSFAQTVAKVR